MQELLITRHRITRSITTPYCVSPAEWDENRREILIPENASPARQKELTSFARKLKKDLHLALSLAESMETQGDYSSQDLVCRFRELQKGQLFCEFINRKVKSLNTAGRFGTAHAYRFATACFFKFLGNKDIRIEKITSTLIKSFKHYLQTKNKSKNTISCYMRSLRAAYNEATGENKLSVLKKTQEKPFADVFTGNAKTEKRAISAQNITDLANLKKENIREKVIRYHRKKTGQLITIEMEDCMKTIIERYSVSNSDYLFPVLRGIDDEFAKWTRTNVALSQYNKNLKRIALLAGIDVHLTGYVSRHSWASLASQEGIPIATISRGMGHESEKTTCIYISQLDYSDVIQANRQIISRVTTTAG